MIHEGNEAAYVYLLAVYLGDGCISEHTRGCYRLRVFQDDHYPGLINLCAMTMNMILPLNKVGFVQKVGCTEINIYSKGLVELFPQHGRGRKHLRSIELEDWQCRLANKYPWRFIEGFIHTDGTKYLRTVKVKGKEYYYPSYGFSNKSGQIRDLCETYLRRVGITPTNPDQRQVHVYKRKDVALMDENIIQKY